MSTAHGSTCIVFLMIVPRYGSFDKLAEDAENQIREILEDDDCPAEKSHALYASFLDVDASTLPDSRPLKTS